MQIIVYIYLTIVSLFTVLHLNDLAGGLELMTIAHYVFAFTFFAKGFYDLLDTRKNNIIGSAGLLVAGIFIGIGLKLSYTAYANNVIELAIVATFVLLFILKVESDEKAIAKPEVRRLLLGLIPMLMVGTFILIQHYDAIFMYHQRGKTTWHESNRVSWDSFEGSPDYNSEYDATIFSNINYRYRVEFDEIHYVAVAYFDRVRSWHKDGTEPLLEHEKMHFDITELYAAKLRYFFEGMKLLDEVPKRRQIDRNAQLILDEWDYVQNKYDDETQHGLDYPEQLRWQVHVDSMLAHYDCVSEAPDRFTAYRDYYYEYDEVYVDGSTAPNVLEMAGEEVFTVVDIMPQFQGGETALQEFLQDRVIYPHLARESGITGIVLISLVVDADGRMRHLNILSGIGGGCDEEALRVVQLMPDWKPGVLEGNPVKVKLTIPIRFSLQ
jgi:TonB family protein